jgi:hypothetical protein
VLKGNEVPSSCTYDTVGNIKQWGNGGKVCRPKCFGFIYASTQRIGEPVKFVPGLFNNLAGAKKKEIQQMAQSTEMHKKITLSKNCVGMIITGQTETSDFKTEGFFVNPDEDKTIDAELDEIAQVTSVQVIEKEMPLPSGNVRFKLRKSPRGYETCLGYGPSHNALDGGISKYVDHLHEEWTRGFNLAGEGKAKPDDNEKQWQLEELAVVLKEQIRVKLYASAMSVNTDKVGRELLKRNLVRQLKDSCQKCYQANVNNTNFNIDFSKNIKKMGGRSYKLEYILTGLGGLQRRQGHLQMDRAQVELHGLKKMVVWHSQSACRTQGRGRPFPQLARVLKQARSIRPSKRVSTGSTTASAFAVSSAGPLGAWALWMACARRARPWS